MLIYICIFLLIAVIRTAYYWERLLFLIKLEKDWFDYLKKNADKDLYRSLLERKSRLINLFKEAKVQQAVLPRVQPVGYGLVYPDQIDVLENFTFKNKKISEAFYVKLCEVVGYYKSRRNENINPLFWIKVIVFLPKLMIRFLGFESFKTLTNLIQMIYWIIGIAGALFSREEIRSFIRNLFK